MFPLALCSLLFVELLFAAKSSIARSACSQLCDWSHSRSNVLQELRERQQIPLDSAPTNHQFYTELLPVHVPSSAVLSFSLATSNSLSSGPDVFKRILPLLHVKPEFFEECLCLTTFISDYYTYLQHKSQVQKGDTPRYHSSNQSHSPNDHQILASQSIFYNYMNSKVLLSDGFVLSKLKGLEQTKAYIRNVAVIPPHPSVFQIITAYSTEVTKDQYVSVLQSPGSSSVHAEAWLQTYAHLMDYIEQGRAIAVVLRDMFTALMHLSKHGWNAPEWFDCFHGTYVYLDASRQGIRAAVNTLKEYSYSISERKSIFCTLITWISNINKSQIILNLQIINKSVNVAKEFSTTLRNILLMLRMFDLTESKHTFSDELFGLCDAAVNELDKLFYILDIGPLEKQSNCRIPGSNHLNITCQSLLHSDTINSSNNRHSPWPGLISLSKNVASSSPSISVRIIPPQNVMRTIGFIRHNESIVYKYFECVYWSQMAGPHETHVALFLDVKKIENLRSYIRERTSIERSRPNLSQEFKLAEVLLYENLQPNIAAVCVIVFKLRSSIILPSLRTGRHLTDIKSLSQYIDSGHAGQQLFATFVPKLVKGLAQLHEYGGVAHGHLAAETVAVGYLANPTSLNARKETNYDQIISDSQATEHGNVLLGSISSTCSPSEATVPSRSPEPNACSQSIKDANSALFCSAQYKNLHPFMLTWAMGSSYDAASFFDTIVDCSWTPLERANNSGAPILPSGDIWSLGILALRVMGASFSLIKASLTSHKDMKHVNVSRVYDKNHAAQHQSCKSCHVLHKYKLVVEIHYGPPERILLLIELNCNESTWANAFEHFVRLCLNPEPSLRPSAIQLLDHNALQEVIMLDNGIESHVDNASKASCNCHSDNKPQYNMLQTKRMRSKESLKSEHQEDYSNISSSMTVLTSFSCTVLDVNDGQQMKNNSTMLASGKERPNQNAGLTHCCSCLILFNSSSDVYRRSMGRYCNNCAEFWSPLIYNNCTVLDLCAKHIPLNPTYRQDPSLCYTKPQAANGSLRMYDDCAVMLNVERFFNINSRSGAVLGKGTNGLVVRAISLQNRDMPPLAIKLAGIECSNDVLDCVEADFTLEEFRCMRSAVEHPNVLRAHGLFLFQSPSIVMQRLIPGYDIQAMAAIVLECATGCLHSSHLIPMTKELHALNHEMLQFDCQEVMTRVSLSTIMEDVVHGLMHLHERKIVHLDLKPENMLLCTVKPEDLGDISMRRTRSITMDVLRERFAGNPNTVSSAENSNAVFQSNVVYSEKTANCKDNFNCTTQADQTSDSHSARLNQHPLLCQRIVLADFGLSGRLANLKNECLSGAVTTSYLTSPEMLNNGLKGQKGRAGTPVDIWALGCLLQQLVCYGQTYYMLLDNSMAKYHTFKNETIDQVLHKWLRDEYEKENVPALTVFEEEPDEIRAFAFACFTLDPDKRVAASQLALFPLLKVGFLLAESRVNYLDCPLAEGEKPLTPVAKRCAAMRDIIMDAPDSKGPELLDMYVYRSCHDWQLWYGIGPGELLKTRYQIAFDHVTEKPVTLVIKDLPDDRSHRIAALGIQFASSALKHIRNYNIMYYLRAHVVTLENVVRLVVVQTPMNGTAGELLQSTAASLDCSYIRRFAEAGVNALFHLHRIRYTHDAINLHNLFVDPPCLSLPHLGPGDHLEHLSFPPELIATEHNDKINVSNLKFKQRARCDIYALSIVLEEIALQKNIGGVHTVPFLVETLELMRRPGIATNDILNSTAYQQLVSQQIG